MSSDKYVMTYMSPISQETSTIMRLLEQTNKEFRGTNRIVKQALSEQILNQGDIDMKSVSPPTLTPTQPPTLTPTQPPTPKRRFQTRTPSPSPKRRSHARTPSPKKTPSTAQATPRHLRYPSSGQPLQSLTSPSREASFLFDSQSILSPSTPPLTPRLTPSPPSTPSKRRFQTRTPSPSPKKRSHARTPSTPSTAQATPRPLRYGYSGQFGGAYGTPPTTPQKQYSKTTPATPATPLSAADTAKAKRSELTTSTVLKIWHFFDSRHDFKPYKGYEFFRLDQKDFNTELQGENQYNQNILWDYFQKKSESENSQLSRLLEITKMKDKDIYLVDNVLYVRIYPTKDDAKKFLMMKKGVDINSPDARTSLRSYVFSNPSDNNRFLIDIKLTQGGMTSDAFDEFIKKFFGEENFAYPLEKIWDPAPSDQSKMEQFEKVCEADTYKQTIDRLNNIFNKPNINNNNDKAFRNLTQDYFNLGYACREKKYDGFLFYIMRKSITKNKQVLQDINKKYETLIKHIQQKAGFELSIHDNYLACRMHLPGFSIANIKNTLWKLTELGISLEKFLIDDASIKGFRNKKFKSDKSKDAKSKSAKTANKQSIEDIQTLVLLFLTHLASFNDDNARRSVLLDLKKSGDWGLASHCYEINSNKKSKTRVFISGDNFTAFYGILRNVPTIFSSETDKLQGVDYNQLSIYIGDMQITYDYFKNIILSYLENDIHLKALKMFFSDKGSESLRKVKKAQKPESFNSLQLNPMKKGMEHEFQKTYTEIKRILSFTGSPTDFNSIFASFKSPNTTNYKICIILSMYLNLLEYYLHDIFNIPKHIKLDFISEKFQKKIRSISVSSQSTAEKACMELLMEFKHAINYAFDFVYFIYLFYVDKTILFELKQYTHNIIQLFLNTKRFLKLGGGRNTRSSQTMFRNTQNTKGDWLKNILESYYTVDETKVGILTLLQVKIDVLLMDSKKLMENMNDTVVRLCRDVILKLSTNNTYNLSQDNYDTQSLKDMKQDINKFISRNVIKPVLESLKIDLINLRKQNAMNLTDEEQNSIAEFIPLISNEPSHNNVSTFVLASFLSIKRDLDAIYDKHKNSIMQEYNSMQSVMRITDDETLNKIILKPQKFEELQKQLEDMNKVIEKIFDIGQYTQEEPLVVVNAQ
jgi:hypothetical protein